MARVASIVLTLLLFGCVDPDPAVGTGASSAHENAQLSQWRAATKDIAKSLAPQLRNSGAVRIVEAPRDAPAYFEEVLVQALVSQGVLITTAAADESEDKTTLACRTMSVGITPQPRGVALVTKSDGGIVIFCRVQWNGSYVAAVDRFVPLRLESAPPSADGVTLKVTQ